MPMQKPIRKVGKKGLKWIAFRRNYLKHHPANHQGYYTCFYCQRWIKEAEITLDHYIPRSRRPDLVFDESNIVLCCGSCNTEKGSRVL